MNKFVDVCRPCSTGVSDFVVNITLVSVERVKIVCFVSDINISEVISRTNVVEV